MQRSLDEQSMRSPKSIGDKVASINSSTLGTQRVDIRAMIFESKMFKKVDPAVLAQIDERITAR